MPWCLQYRFSSCVDCDVFRRKEKSGSVASCYSLKETTLRPLLLPNLDYKRKDPTSMKATPGRKAQSTHEESGSKLLSGSTILQRGYFNVLYCILSRRTTSFLSQGCLVNMG